MTSPVLRINHVMFWFGALAPELQCTQSGDATCIQSQLAGSAPPTGTRLKLRLGAKEAICDLSGKGLMKDGKRHFKDLHGDVACFC